MTEEESYTCLKAILSGSVDPDEIYRWLVTLQKSPETVDEMVGFSKAMRDHMVRAPLFGKVILDVCGTGGVLAHRFNTSTAVAFVLAAGGVRVAKHGNRGSRAANGSFDFLESLGIYFGHDPAALKALYEQTHLCFLFARTHHPAMRFVASARQKIGSRTIFNCLGPLNNPSGATHQVLGTVSMDLANKLVEAFIRLGTQRALVVCAEDSLDEFSISAKTRVLELNKGQVTSFEFDPSLYMTAKPSPTLTGKAIDNADLFISLVSQGQIDHAISDLICLNAGAGFYTVGKTDSIESGFRLAQALFQDGSVWQKVLTYRALATQYLSTF